MPPTPRATPAVSARWQRSTFARYGVAVAAWLVAAYSRQVLAPIIGDTSPFVQYYPAIMFSAWYGGAGPGVVTTLLSALNTAYFVLPPLPSLSVAAPGSQFSLGLFLLAGAVIAGLIERLHEKHWSAADDAASLRRQQEALLRSESRKAAMLEAALDAIITIDAAGRVQEWNASAERLFGYSRQDAMGRAMEELIIPEAQRERHVAALRRHLATGESAILGRRVELTALRADGTEFPVELAVSRTEVDGVLQFDGFIQDLTERRRAETELRESQSLFCEFMDHLPAPAFVRTDGGELIYVNAGYERFFGSTLEELRKKPLHQMVPPEVVTRLQAAYQQVREENRPVGLTAAIPDPAGNSHEFRFHLFPIRRAGGRRFLGGIAVDISEQRQLEHQFHQVQKMEAVGRLAGGVAHDMNNVLAVINGYSELLLDTAGLDTRVRARLNEIRGAGERAAGLTRQLLAFSRRQVLAPAVLDLNEVIGGLVGMLRRLIGEDVELALLSARELGKVRADRGQVEQVLMNLAVNARDAMPTGGQITIETQNTFLDRSYCEQHAGVDPGPYVVFSVSDTGCGIPKEMQERIFEPFFTTKDPGKGTGLGLATAFGIVKQSGGHVSLYSEPGIGSTFRVYLPRAEGTPEACEPELPPTESIRGTETILLAEDEDGVRWMVREALRAVGYSVLIAATPAEALEIAAGHPGPIDLLLSDVVMPGMGGRELAERVDKLRPNTRVLFMSGYTDDAIVRHGVLAARMAFIQKPFSPAALARKIREVLDGD